MNIEYWVSFSFKFNISRIRYSGSGGCCCVLVCSCVFLDLKGALALLLFAVCCLNCLLFGVGVLVILFCLFLFLILICSLLFGFEIWCAHTLAPTTRARTLTHHHLHHQRHIQEPEWRPACSMQHARGRSWILNWATATAQVQPHSDWKQKEPV